MAELCFSAFALAADFGLDRLMNGQLTSPLVDLRQIGAEEALGDFGDVRQVDIAGDGALAQVRLQDGLAGLVVRLGNVDQLIQTAWSQDGRIDDVRTVGGTDDEDDLLGQDLVDDSVGPTSSSKNSTQGEAERALSKMSRTLASDSPNNIVSSSGPLTEMKLAWHSLAMALASSVLKKSWRSVEQNTARWLHAKLQDLVRMFHRVLNQFLQLALDVLQPTDIGPGRVRDGLDLVMA